MSSMLCVYVFIILYFFFFAFCCLLLTLFRDVVDDWTCSREVASGISTCFVGAYKSVLFLQEEHSTYPDMAAYHSIAVTLGKAGHLTELLHIIRSLKEGPVRRNVGGSPRELNWNGRLEPDIVVYNAVSRDLNLLVPATNILSWFRFGYR